MFQTKKPLVVLVFPLVLAVSAAALGADERPTVKASVKTKKSVVLVGEPLVLELSAANVHSEALSTVPADTSDGDDSWQILVSSDGKTFHRYVADWVRTGGSHWSLDTLPPGQTLTRVKTMVFQHERRDAQPGPAFSTPGKYVIKARFPLKTPKSNYKVEYFDAEPIEVEIRLPVGDDAKVWDLLKSEDMLRFVQFPSSYDNHKQLASEVADILQAYPNCTYAPHLRTALRRVFSRTTFEANESSRIAGLSGARDSRTITDDRLNAEVIFAKEQYKTAIPVEQLLALMQNKTGVGLTVSSSLRGRLAKPASSLLTLHDQMVQFQPPQWHLAWWHSYRGGYVLVADEDIEEFLPQLAKEAQR